MSINEQMVQDIVQDVLAKMQIASDVQGDRGVFKDMNEAIEAAKASQKIVAKMSLDHREKVISNIRKKIMENAEILARMGVQETGMGNVGHKILKHQLVAEKTPGTEDITTQAWSGDRGLTLIEMGPFGVIGAITPCTNPSETVLCNTIGMFAGGNTVVFNPHPAAIKTSIYAVNLLNEASVEVGGPDNIACTVEHPTLETSNIMMKHPAIQLIAATGGPGVVTAVLSSGRRGIGAGAGNPPALVDETADIRKAAEDIVNGCTFDNNLPCIAEKEVIAVDQIADYLIFNMKNNGAYEVKDPEIIEKMVDLVTKDRKKPAVNFVGKSAQYILDKVGIKVGPEVKCIIMEAPKDHPFVQIELMMPILPIVRVPNVDEAIDFAVEVEHGNRHTAMMHSKNVDKLTKMAKEIETTIFVKNGPSYAGIGVGGMGYTTFTIAGPTGEGLTSAKSFCRKRRCVLQDGLHIRMK